MSCLKSFSSIDQIQKNQETETELLNESEDLSESVDLPASDLSSVCDSSDERFYTPALSLSDLYFNVPCHTISSGSDSESNDSFHTAVCSLSDLLEDDEDENEIQGEFTFIIPTHIHTRDTTSVSLF